MAMDQRTVKVYETEKFALLTHGARLFRFSRTQNDAAINNLQLVQNKADELAVALTAERLISEECSGEDLKAVMTKMVEIITTSLPVERDRTCNFIDRRINAIDLDKNILSKQDRMTLQRGMEPRREMADVAESGAEISADAKRACLTCAQEFADAGAQRRHYQLDWHRCNLHRALRRQAPITEEQFAALVDADDVSSISGSESDCQETDSECAEPTNEGLTGVGPEGDRHVRVYFENSLSHVFSLHRCLLHAKKETMSEERLIASCRELGENTRWAVILAGGGHFAAAIFHGEEMLLHKTFHSYTVRRGQGTAQSQRDARGNAPKSAGAALRRRNELALSQDIGALLELWRAPLVACSLLFVRASPAQRTALFGGRRPALSAQDARLRKLPFATRRATLAECTRAHALLATAHEHGPALAYQQSLVTTKPAPPPAPKSARIGPTQLVLVRDVSREPQPQPKQQPEQQTSSSDEQDFSGDGLELQTELVDLGSLREYDLSAPKRQRKPRRGRRRVKQAQEGEGQETRQIGNDATRAVLQPGEVADTSLLEKQADSDGAGANTEAARKEKRLAARRMRRERLRDKREQELRERDDAAERERFLQLSDREKRALVAERRLASSSAPIAAVRCFLCAAEMAGKVPFCYLEMRFCSIVCLQAHRKAKT